MKTLHFILKRNIGLIASRVHWKEKTIFSLKPPFLPNNSIETNTFGHKIKSLEMMLVNPISFLQNGGNLNTVIVASAIDDERINIQAIHRKKSYRVSALYLPN